MWIIECGNLYRKWDDPYLPTQGLIIEATREELSALDFNQVFAEVKIIKATEGGDLNGQVRRQAQGPQGRLQGQVSHGG